MNKPDDAEDFNDLSASLSMPFDPAEVKWKPAVVSGDRALALAYIDARVVQDRLDNVVGVAGWQDAYDLLPGGSVACRLSLRVGTEWLCKCDVGSPSEQPDDGDKMKAAYSDALKRAAVKFGVGRYLYRLPSQWCDYDPKAKKFKTKPQLPAWAIPPKKIDLEDLQKRGVSLLHQESLKGVKALATAWQTMSPDMRMVCKAIKDFYKDQAVKADAEREPAREKERVA